MKFWLKGFIKFICETIWHCCFSWGREFLDKFLHFFNGNWSIEIFSLLVSVVVIYILLKCHLFHRSFQIIYRKLRKINSDDSFKYLCIRGYLGFFLFLCFLSFVLTVYIFYWFSTEAQISLNLLFSNSCIPYFSL